jgi:hypothetical protein
MTHPPIIDDDDDDPRDRADKARAHQRMMWRLAHWSFSCMGAALIVLAAVGCPWQVVAGVGASYVVTVLAVALVRGGQADEGTRS